MGDSSEPQWRRLLALVEPFHDDARLVARRIARSRFDGDDLFHEALLRALDKLPALRDEARFRPWFFRILFSVHRSRCRRGFWRRVVALDAVDAEPADDAAAGPEDRGAADRAARALGTLPPAQREAIVLFELHDYTVVEIAALQGASPSAVKSRLSRGRARLRRFYRRIGHAPQLEEEHREYSNAHS